MIAPLLAAIDSVASAPSPAWAAAASVAAGGLVGVSLGLTGGGAIFAVPLLICWIGVDPRTAVSISLVTVAATALVGMVERWRSGQVELPTGLLFAAFMGVPRAVGTSLLVMALVGAAGVASQTAAARSIPLDIVGGFVAGSIPGLLAGSFIGRQFTGPPLAKIFAAAGLPPRRGCAPR
jgi:uncharacterized membrane protein YfcA